jgi:hypothetical protein
MPGYEATWSAQWSRVMDEAGAVIAGQSKGYAKVEW